jgi:hypothetical protein
MTEEQKQAILSALGNMDDGWAYHGEGELENLQRKVRALVEFAHAVAEALEVRE